MSSNKKPLKLPTLSSFLTEYPRYTTLLSTKRGKYLFETIAVDDFANAAIVITQHIQIPAVSAAPYFLKEDMSGKDIEKQFLGALTCSIMQLNGYKKTGVKKAVPQKGFTKGEVYEPKV